MTRYIKELDELEQALRFPRGDGAQESYNREEMEDYTGRCEICGGMMGLLGCVNCGDFREEEGK